MSDCKNRLFPCFIFTIFASKNIMHIKVLYFLCLLANSIFGQNAIAQSNSTTIPLAGNTFFSNYGEKGIELSKLFGITNWRDPSRLNRDVPSVSATIFVRFLEKGTYTLTFNAKAKSANTLKVSIENKH